MKVPRIKKINREEKGPYSRLYLDPLPILPSMNDTFVEDNQESPSEHHRSTEDKRSV